MKIQLTLPLIPARLLYVDKLQTTRKRYAQGFREISRWFTPGLGVKRWFFVVLAGITLLGVGLAILLLDLYRTDSDPIILGFLSFASLRFLPRLLKNGLVQEVCP